MPVVYFTLPLSGLLVFALVLGLGAFLTRRFKLGWSLFWIGGAVFVLSQVLHIPFNAYILPNLIPSLPEPWAFYFLGFAVGLSSGVFEEGARYLMYRFWTRNARTWKQGVLLGAGHGGVEALFIGGLILWTAVNLWALRGQDLNLILSPEQASLAQRQIASLETLAWYETLAGFVERLFVLPAHIFMSVLVLQVFRRGQMRWLFFAVLWHTLLNAVGAVYVPQTLGGNWPLATVGVFGLVSLVLLLALRSPDPAEPAPEEPEPLQPIALKRAAESDEQIEASRFNR
jgi:uncharacterized membrane protein YhfC